MHRRCKYLNCHCTWKCALNRNNMNTVRHIMLDFERSQMIMLEQEQLWNVAPQHLQQLGRETAEKHGKGMLTNAEH